MDGRAIANFVLDECERDGRPITNLALQKVVYFCHVWTLVKLREPLVKQQFEAWQFGPVLQYLYREFKGFEREPITVRARRLNPNTGDSEIVPYKFEPELEQLLREVVKLHSALSPSSLVQLTHVTNGPWQRVWNHEGRVNPGMNISDDSIVEFYVSKQPARSPVQ